MRFLILVLALIITAMFSNQHSKNFRYYIERYAELTNPLIGKYVNGPWLSYLLLVGIPCFFLFIMMSLLNSGIGLLLCGVLDLGLLLFCLALHESCHALLTGHIESTHPPTTVILEANTHLLPTILIYIAFGPIVTLAYKITDELKSFDFSHQPYNLKHACTCVSATFLWITLRVSCIAYAFISDFSKLLHVFKMHLYTQLDQNHLFNQQIAEAIVSQDESGDALALAKDIVKRALISILTAFALYKILFGIR